MALVTCQECASCSFGLNGCDRARVTCVQRVVFRHRWRLFLHPLSAPWVSLQTASWCSESTTAKSPLVSLYEGLLRAEGGEVSHWGEGSGVSSGCVSRAGGECCYGTAGHFIHMSEDRQQKYTRTIKYFYSKLPITHRFLVSKGKNVPLPWSHTSAVQRCVSSYSALHIILQEWPAANRQQLLNMAKALRRLDPNHDWNISS